jgi:hypothetical protein
LQSVVARLALTARSQEGREYGEKRERLKEGGGGGRARGRREKAVMERIKIGRNELNERIEGKRGIQNAG